MSAPILEQTSPTDNLSGVAVTANLVLRFDQQIRLGTSGTIRIYNSDGTLIHTISITDATQVSLEISSRPERVIINPNIDLLPGTGYYVLIDAGAIENRDGVDYAGISSPTAFNFTTAGSPPGGDTTAPTLTSTTPLDDATGVAVGANLVLTFSESVQAGSGNIEIHNTNGTIAKTIAVTDATQVSFVGNQLTINPTTDLVAGSGYYVTMALGVVRDLANNDFVGISSSTTFNFTTASPPGDTTAPTLLSSTPADNATNIQTFANIVLNFSETVKAGTGNIEIHKVSDGSIAMSIAVTDTSQVTFSGSQLTVNPIGSFASETSYYVTMGSGVVLDAANNPFAGLSSSTELNFTTRESTPPLLTDTSPDPNSLGVPVGADIILTFTEDVKAGTGNIIIKNSDDDSIVQSIAITDTSQVTFSGNQVTINPASDLAEGGHYYVLIGSGVIRDLANNAFAGLGYWGLPFATTDTTAPTLASTSPADNATGVAAGADLVLTFSEHIKPGSGNIVIHNSSDGSVAMTISIDDWPQAEISTNHLTINPSTDLTQGASYYVTMDSGVVLDYANNAFAGMSSPSAFNFTILPDTIAPLLTESSPVDGATDVGTQSDLVLTFSEDVKVGSGNIEIRNSLNGSLVQSIAVTDASKVSFSGNQVTINPSDLSAGVSYYVTLGSGVIRDLANNAFAGISSPTDLNFSTVPYSIVGTPGVDNLVGADNRNDSFDGLPSVDTLTGGTGDDIYYIKNYEGGQTSLLIYSEDFQDVFSVLPTDEQLTFHSLFDQNGDGQIDVIWGWYSGDSTNKSWSFEAPYGTNLAVGGTYSYGSAGTFTIVAMEIDYTDPENPVLTKLSITYEEDYDYQPKYFGRVNYNYAAAGAATLDSVVENPGGGTDTVVAFVNYTLPANVENLTLAGYENLNGTGNSLNNVIRGNYYGDNLIDGGIGADTMAGDGGSDTYIVDNAGDLIVEEGYWYGTDLVLSSVTYSLSPYVDNLTLTGSGNINGTGNELNNELRGNTGINVLTGGDGNDTYFVGSGDSVVEGLNAGHDEVESSVTHTLSDNVEDLSLIGNGNINGTGNGLDNVLTGTNKLPGTDGQNVLTGGAGNDTLDGKTGVDTLVGGLGDDLYIIDNYEGGQNSILLQSDPGEYVGMGWNISFLTDPTSFSVTTWDGTGDGIVDAIRLHYYDYEAPPYYHSWYFEFSTTQLGTNLVPGTYANAERFAFASSGHPGMDVYGDGRGGGYAGSFTVTQAVFDYSSGAPVLVSLSISFEKNSGPGTPTLYGVINYNYAPAGAPVLDTVVENAGQGIDTVLASVSYTLGANVENLTLNRADHINGTGNSLDNVITGNPGNNVLDGKAGADTMDGGGGGDTFVVDNVGDVVIEEFDFYADIYLTFDTVQSSITYVLPNEVERLTLTGAANINGTGNELDNTLTGNIGNNVLNSGLGADMLIGADGNDTFNILAGAGSDTIEDFSAGTGVGDLVVLDGFALGSFSAVQAAMTQNGADTILNLGNGESLTFLNVLKSSFAANDFTFLNVQGPPPPPPGPPPFTLPVSGAYTTTISGTRRADNLTGTSANNQIDGKQGADTMTGLAGDDTYVVDSSNDSVVESSNNGIDTVISSASSYTLANNVENLTLTGTINHTATGNSLNNLIIASSRPDIINGGAGNDIIRAGAGACVLTGGAGNDIFDFDVIGVQKQITDFTAGEDLVDLRTLLAWYGGSNPLADNVISLSAVSGGVLVSVKASAGGSLQGLVKITGVSVGDLDVGSDILWDA